MAKSNSGFRRRMFRCIEAVFQRLTGVSHVESGTWAEGGPSYLQTGVQRRYGHVEVVRVSFDPDLINYRELLDVFFTVHDPTTLNRQGNDAGEQYRSVISTAMKSSNGLPRM